MTPRPDPSDLASDLADGLLSGEDAARAAAMPEVAARVEEIYQLRAALREVPQAPELPKARTLSAAVDAGMDARDPASGSPGSGARRPWLAAAAILAVVALGAGLVALRGNGDGDVTASEMADDSPAETREGDEASGSASDTGEEVPQAPREGGDGESLAAEEEGEPPAATVDLGTVADQDELAAAVAGAARSSRTAEPDAASEPHQTDTAEAGDHEQGGQCPQLTKQGDPERGLSTLFATATLSGERVWVHLYPSGAEGSNALLVATNSACVDVVDRIVPADS